MSNHTPLTPSFIFGYWRPWKENAQLFDSYLDYRRDTSLVRYGADTVGKYVKEASSKQIRAINKLGEDIGRGINILSHQLTDINDSLIFLNRNIDILIEQNKLSNLLLQDIIKLLRVPDIEKERQHCIELGVKFFVNAAKDPDLFQDALDELLKAESLMKQDYFVLHRIGCIYLYAEKFINPALALDYFSRAGKYASVESHEGAISLANALTDNANVANSGLNNSKIQMGFLAADSYEKAAFAAYVIGDFAEAVSLQTKATTFKRTPNNKFVLSKYLIRAGKIDQAINNLNECIIEEPILAVAAFKEIDLINEPAVIELISGKNTEVNNRISELANKWENIDSVDSRIVVSELNDLLEKSYEVKVAESKRFELKEANVTSQIGEIEDRIDTLIEDCKVSFFINLDEVEIAARISKLKQAKKLPLEKMQRVFYEISKELESAKLKIGSRFAGGIVFFIDKSGKHGLVCAEQNFGKAIWGAEGLINASENGVADGGGNRNTQKIFQHSSTGQFKGLFYNTSVPITTSARICVETKHNGYVDWYLPTVEELLCMYLNLEVNGLGNLDDEYWSSTEVNSSHALMFSFFYGDSISAIKTRHTFNIRPVRAF